MALVNKSSSAPGTPAPQTPLAAVPPSPGTWRHPKFDEIARRQQASTFNDRNITKILWNTGTLIATCSSVIPLSVPETITNYLGPYPFLTLHILWNYIIPLVFLYNIFTAFSPLILHKDEFTDIPLTPSQRSLLGLDPDATPPATPGTTYITPPRYPRSATPTRGTPGSRSSSAAGSPVSRKGSPIGTTGGQGSGEGYSPAGSPLWQKAVGSRESRRHSYGLSSPLGMGGAGTGGPGKDLFGKDMSVYSVPSTPSPTGGRGAASVPLNSRWLYERGRSLSGSRSIYSG
ncbi:hypothetical protein MMC30_005164 [Trapelia coarctata]|nr:hypothetical protein [Trapelia coarctata]